MQKIIAGSVMLLSGAGLYIGVRISQAIVQAGTVVQPGSTAADRFMSAAGITIGVLGLFILLLETYLKEFKEANKQAFAERNEKFEQRYGLSRSAVDDNQQKH